METPPSRVYGCFLEGPENPKSAACKTAAAGGTQALYDWNGVNQGNANGNHQAVVPDGQLCGAGKALFKGLNLARSDWPSTAIAPDASGNFQFVYKASAPHADPLLRLLHHQGRLQPREAAGLERPGTRAVLLDHQRQAGERHLPDELPAAPGQDRQACDL